MYLTSIGDHLRMDDNVPQYVVIYDQHQMSQEDNAGVMKDIILILQLKENHDETLPIINKQKHLKKGQYKEQNGVSTHIQEDKRTT